MSGKSARAAMATATDVTSTSPIASSPIGRRFALKSRSDVKNAAAQRWAAGRRRRRGPGRARGIAMPGTSPTRKPAATWRIGGGTGRRRAIAVTATTTAANAIARTIGGKCVIQPNEARRTTRQRTIFTLNIGDPTAPHMRSQIGRYISMPRDAVTSPRSSDVAPSEPLAEPPLHLRPSRRRRSRTRTTCDRPRSPRRDSPSDSPSPCSASSRAARWGKAC